MRFPASAIRRRATSMWSTRTSGGAVLITAWSSPRIRASWARSSPNVSHACETPASARACQKFSPVSEVIPAVFRPPSQSKMKLIQRPSGSCIQSTNSSRPVAHRFAQGSPVRAHTSHITSSSRAVSSTHATPSNPDSFAEIRWSSGSA